MQKALAVRKDWTETGPLAEGQKAAKCHLWETEGKLNGRAYRFVVVHSSNLDERRLQALERNAAKEGKMLEGVLAELRCQEFVCAPDAQKAWERFVDKQSPLWHKLTGKAEGQERKVKRARPGRPRKDEEPKMEMVYRLEAQMERDGERYW